MIYGGIDPGLSGAIAFILEDGGVLIEDAPIFERSGKRKPFPHAMAALLAPYCERKIQVGIEYVSGRPGEGAASARTTGAGWGMWIGVLATLGIEYVDVSPASWKRNLGLLKCDKEASRAKALQLYPGSAKYLQRKGDHNRAEALLIAHYVLLTGRR